MMSSEQFNAWADRYQLSTEQAARVLGISRATGFKYANGSQPVSKAVAYGAQAIDLLAPQGRSRLIQARLSTPKP